MEHHWQIVKAGTTAANTPQELMEQAFQYFKWCDEHPIKASKRFSSGKKAGEKYDEETARPYNLKAFCLHAGITEEYIRDIRMTHDQTSDYYHVISRIIYIIFTQNYELAVSGIYNPIFTAKVLNVGSDDAPQAPVRIEIVGGEIPLSKTENEVLEKLELENQGGRIIEI